MTWEWHRLGDLLLPQTNRKVVQQGWSPRCYPNPAPEDGWGVLKTTAIQNGRFEPEHNKELPEHLAPREQIEVHAGDLLMTCAGPRARCGVPALVRQTRPRLMMSGKMYRIRPDERLRSDFLELWLRSPEAQRRIDGMKTGISDSGLNLTHGRFVELPVPLPPYAEQQRVVDLLEDHLSRLDAADAGVLNSLLRLNALKRSLLAELHVGPTLPLADLAWDSDYGTSEKCLANGPGAPVVRIPNLVNGMIDLADEKRVADPGADVSNSMLAVGDLLIVRTNGSVDLIGRSAVVQHGIEAAFASYLIRYRLREELVRPGWVHAMLSTPQLRRTIEPLAASSAGQHNLSLGKLHPLRVPIPSLEQQDAGLARIRELEARIASLRTDSGRARRHSGALRQSLLTTAFSGRLTEATADLLEAEEMIGV